MNWWVWLIIGASCAAYLWAWRWNVRFWAWTRDYMNPAVSIGGTTPTRCGMGWLFFCMFVCIFTTPFVVSVALLIWMGRQISKQIKKLGSEKAALRIKGVFSPLDRAHRELVREKGGLR